MNKSIIALVAHDSRKSEMTRLVSTHCKNLAEFNLIATMETGQLIKERFGLPVTLVASGPRGGYQQIEAMAYRPPATLCHNQGHLTKC